MISNPALTVFTVAPVSVVNGATNSYEISFTSGIKLIDNDYI